MKFYRKRAKDPNKQSDTADQHKKARPRKLKARGPIYHSIHRFRHLTRHQQRRHVRVGLVLLVIMLIITGAVIYKDYHERPGILEGSSLKATEAGTNKITLEWKGTRNTDSYTIYYKKKGESPLGWHKVTIDNQKGSKDSVTLKNLEEGTKYGVIIRADNDERNGFSTKEKYFSTRITQHIVGRTHYTKLTCSKDFRLGLQGSTPLTYESDDESVVKIGKNGKIKITGSGTAKIKVTAIENKKYISDSVEAEIEVIDTYPADAGGASAHVIYSLSPDNCEAVKAISGTASADIPQAFGYTGEKYIVAYGMYSASSQRIFTFDKDGDGKSESVPQISIGHPNGFCYVNSTGKCYCVKGGSVRAVTYDPETGEYGTATFPSGAHALGYDRIEDKVYAASGGIVISYGITDDGFVTEHRYGTARHSQFLHGQDCGGHAGIMMRCLSPSNTHGTNYVDLYDMKNGKYLGSILCELSEVESATVDDEGYLLLLGNTTDRTDYIWKTPINIEDIGAGISD